MSSVPLVAMIASFFPLMARPYFFLRKKT